MTNHTNDERTVHCPVEECDATPLARGINLHLRRSSGDGHGPRGEVPDHISTDNLETVGSESVQMDYPEKRDTENHARLCPYCNQTFAGEQGMMIHLGQMAGRNNHPVNPKDRHEPSDFPRVEVDAEGNVQSVVGTTEMAQIENSEAGTVPTTRIFRLIATLIAEGRPQTARHLRRALPGVNNIFAPPKDEPAHSELFEALLTQGRSESPNHRVAAALEREGLMIAVRGECGFLNSEELRDVAARLERVGAAENWLDEDITEFIRFLRYGADVLDGDKMKRGFHEEFSHWR